MKAGRGKNQNNWIKTEKEKNEKKKRENKVSEKWENEERSER